MHNKVAGTALPSPLALAYLGDARHALYVRNMLVRQGIAKPAELNKRALMYVTAEAQAEAYRRIEAELAEDERDIFRRAANTHHLNKPKHASVADYRHATGFEAIIGMLTYLGDEERLGELFEKIYKEKDENDTEN